MKTILVLFGGRSTEYGVSLQSAHGVLSHLDRARFRPLTVGITREGRWLYYSGPLARLEDDTWHQAGGVPCTLSLDFGCPQLLLLDGSNRRLAFDAAFPILHGKNGEDGTVQGLLELTGAPLIGCGCLRAGFPRGAGHHAGRGHHRLCRRSAPVPVPVRRPGSDSGAVLPHGGTDVHGPAVG